MYRSGRRNWKSGLWLIQDEESGVICYSNDVARDYTGKFVRKQYVDRENPQDFIKGLNDPRPLPYTNPFPTSSHVCNFPSVFIGNTSVTARTDGPADHLFQSDGIGDMSIGCSFIIYPEVT